MINVPDNRIPKLADGDHGSPRVAIVLVNFHGTSDTLKCLDSIHAINSESCMTVVVENGTRPDPSGQILESHPWITLLRREENGGWAGGNNAGISHALEHGVEWILLLNNDTVVAPEILTRLMEAASCRPDAGILGPIICFMDDPETVMTDGCRFNRRGYSGFFERIPVPIAQADPPSVVPVDIVNGCCMMISHRVFERIGLIDERFFLIHEESDFCLRAHHAGFESGIVAKPLVWHKGSSTFKRTGKGLQRYYDARNLALLLWKDRAVCPDGRGLLSSWLMYLKYVYYRYCIEHEQRELEAADAVLSGLLDGLSGRFGPRHPPYRFALPVLRWLFRTVHALSSARPKNWGHADAVSVRQA